MPAEKQAQVLTGALEDYLETVYELVRDKRFARIKDIAKARGVKSGSVSPAMRRLSDMGLVNYLEREYIDLTPEGERLARRVYAKHQVLTRFFADVLAMDRTAAVADACAMEHNLSDEGMEHLVRFFEFLEGCPEGVQFLNRFHNCSLVHPDRAACGLPCPRREETANSKNGRIKALSKLNPGDAGRVFQIVGTGAIRKTLLEKGFVPDALVSLEKRSPRKQKLVVDIDGYHITLTLKEAAAVIVVVDQR